ncbi:MAG: hypothetical protein HQL26_06190 [Candidatus Omnitrophica bacterium]|nr:hypothetical protein [Candidatus Omnitrophota bacterium]
MSYLKKFFKCINHIRCLISTVISSNVHGLWFWVFGKNQLFQKPATNHQQPTTNNFILRDLTPLLAAFLLFATPSFAVVDFTGDVNEFIKNNPDGQKFDFMSRYIETLGYLESNEKLSKQFIDVNLLTAPADKVKTYLDALVNANVNLRVSRNYLKRYGAVNNGLIRKVVQDFQLACDELITNNQGERLLVEKIYNAQMNHQKRSGMNTKEFSSRIEQLTEQRRGTSTKILQTSMWASKVLISNKVDKFGSLYMLGISADQRKELLEQLSKYKGKEYRGELRPGQSFLQASIAAIAAILEDESWGNLTN